MMSLYTALKLQMLTGTAVCENPVQHRYSYKVFIANTRVDFLVLVQLTQTSVGEITLGFVIFFFSTTWRGGGGRVQISPSTAHWAPL